MTTQSPEIITPIIHLNGTSACCLVEQRDAMYRILDDALVAMKNVAPNGRDYYPEPGRLEKAEEQHRRRCQIIQDLRDEFETEIGMIEGWAP